MEWYEIGFLFIWFATGIVAWSHKMALEGLFKHGTVVDFLMIIPCSILGGISAIICLVADIRERLSHEPT